MSIGETVTLEDLERDPYPIYERLRDEEPVSWVPAVGLWLVTRYDDVRTVDLHPELFTAATEPSTLNRTMGVNMLGQEGPEHARIRAIVEPPFRPRDVEDRTQGMIPRLATELIDGFERQGAADLFRAYCDPLSVRSLRFMLGLDEVAWEDILGWNEGLMVGLANFEGDAAKQGPADAASEALGGAIASVLERLEREPDGSVLSWMLHQEGEGIRDVPRGDRGQHEADAVRRLAGTARCDRAHPPRVARAPRPARGGPGRPFLGEGRGGGDPPVGRAGGNVDPPGGRGHGARGGAAPRRRPRRRRPVLGQPRSAPVDRARTASTCADGRGRTWPSRSARTSASGPGSAGTSRGCRWTCCSTGSPASASTPSARRSCPGGSSGRPTRPGSVGIPRLRIGVGRDHLVGRDVLEPCRRAVRVPDRPSVRTSATSPSPNRTRGYLRGELEFVCSPSEMTGEPVASKRSTVSRTAACWCWPNSSAEMVPRR